MQSIRVPGNFTWENSQKPENKAKNRYKNIIPCKLVQGMEYNIIIIMQASTLVDDSVTFELVQMDRNKTVGLNQFSKLDYCELIRISLIHCGGILSPRQVAKSKSPFKRQKIWLWTREKSGTDVQKEAFFAEQVEHRGTRETKLTVSLGSS